MSDFEVKRNELGEVRVEDGEVPAIEDGQALLRVESFGLTANNITYGQFGDAMSYWKFFPVDDEWGRIPVWGFAVVEESHADGLEAGTRVYGYLPPSSHLVVTPGFVGESGFVDETAHRAELPPTYNRYFLTDGDPFWSAETEPIQLLLRPLFFTAFLIGDQLADEGFTARGPVIISSASSKTAIGTAFLLNQREGVEIIGLTSPRSAEFAEGLGIYDRVVTYDDVDSLGDGPASYVDIAGDASVRRSIHERFADDLLLSMVVGMTHRDGLDGGEGALPGPAPAFFFAPDRVTKRAADWGPAKLEETVAGDWHPFREWMDGWFEPIVSEGFDQIEGAYRDVLEGRVEPSKGHVISLSST